MKNNHICILLILGLFAFIGCGGSSGSGSSSTSSTNAGKLTTEKAESTLNRWVSGGQVTVRGIQESGNAAQADLTFTDFAFTLKGGGGGTYSGAGTAIFTHYNDGRWVLTKVATNQGYKSVRWENLSVEVY
jgi:hypothetical protein